MENVRKDDYSILKTMTTLLVVLGHITVFYSSTRGAIAYPVDGLMDILMKFIYQFHMQLFVFTSGAVYGLCIRKGKYQEFWPFVTNKAKRLLLPFLAFGLLNVTPVMVGLGITTHSPVGYIVHGILLGRDTRHLWYLLTLFTMLLMTRMAKPLLDHWRWMIWILFAGAVGLFLVYPWIPSLFSLFNTARMYVFFLCGYLYDSYAGKLGGLIRKGYLAVVLLAIMVALAIRGTGRITGPAASFCGIMLSLIIVRRFGGWISGRGWFAGLQRNSMGIYLFHPMFNYCIFWLLKNAGLHPWLQCALAFPVVLILSWLSTEGMRRCRLGVLMGE